MGYNSMISGSLVFSTHLWASEIRAVRAALGSHSCLTLDVESVRTDTDWGHSIEEKGIALVACSGEHKHYDFLNELQRIVDVIADECRANTRQISYTGRIDWEGERNEDLSRIKVIDGKVAQFEPEIVWPEESE